jgi:hypothetical protein
MARQQNPDRGPEKVAQNLAAVIDEAPNQYPFSTKKG